MHWVDNLPYHNFRSAHLISFIGRGGGGGGGGGWGVGGGSEGWKI